ncbi:hypothetical protein [Psychrobacillus lasiicapitis]|uniref:Uncharacterized protein n=1 Tax=Psychrobacillus lasiicapitis TaxID=1636719 RepID=A0A544SSV4_9BACI|nr:hypothetical protein [Psychrobacillus lasiicapitis]TQR08279.1 hypothetical protein FG382_21560 [Psychrobacillus lasiicapitis]GGA48588.1 hypothetical protein GCM10011384_42870 [Psychrobacillus lasiicapitis]
MISQQVLLIEAQGGDTCGISGTGETPQERATRRLTARPSVSVRLERKSIAFAVSLYLIVSLASYIKKSMFSEENILYV